MGLFAGNDCSDVKVFFFRQKGEINFKIQFFGPDRLLHNLQQFAVKNSKHCEHNAFDEERIMKDRNQYGEWRGVGPSSYLGPRLAVRDGRGSYIMSTGMLISVPFTDTLTRHDDTMTF